MVVALVGSLSLRLLDWLIFDLLGFLMVTALILLITKIPIQFALDTVFVALGSSFHI